MNRIQNLVFPGLFFTILLIAFSCVHEPTPTCEGVIIKLELSKTDSEAGSPTGTITVAASGDSKFFTYSINDIDYQAGNKFTGLDSGKYTVTVKNSWGCKSAATISIAVANACGTVTLSSTVLNTTPGASTGKITALLVGGTGYTYSINAGAFQSSNIFSGLAAGNYTVTAKNTAGCTFSTQATIGVTDPCAGVTVVVTSTFVNPTGTSSNGSITGTATGGTGFTYSLNSGAFQSSGVFTGLTTGNYTLTAKNSNGCVGTTTVAIGANNPCAGVSVAVTAVVTNTTAGASTGSLVVSATGGSGFTYSINNGAYQATPTFSNLAAGTYAVSAKNSAGCLGSASFVVGSSDPCLSTTITITGTPSVSNNCVTPGTGSIIVAASGSTGFTYNINNGAYQASATFSALAPATYTVGVKDVNGCTKTLSVIVGTTPAGPTFALLKTLIQSRCSGSGCHTNGQTQKGYNFDTDCKIVSAWSGINGSCITGTLAKMPISPQANLTAAEKLTITNWINAGHGFAN